jgi:two-component system phosphate regulon sensor histidine kinase PhoR
LDLLEQAYTNYAPQYDEVGWPDKRIFSALVTPIENGGNVVALHDVTRFKELERVKNEFIATASHDLKNPIATITGFSALMEQAGPLTDMQQEFVGRIQAASNVMNDLVQNLLQLVQLDLTAEVSVNRETVTLDELIAKVAHEYAPQAEAKRQKLIVEHGQTPFIVQGDAQQLTQVLRNLVGNAIKYTPREGTIRVSQEIVDGCSAVHVRDTGYGIPADHLPNIFNRFHRVRTDDTKDIEGNGLGLAIVKSIVERHSGQMIVESELGKGSCFTVLLPLASPGETARLPVKGVPKRN